MSKNSIWVSKCNGKDVFAEPIAQKIKENKNFQNNHYIERISNLKLIEFSKEGVFT